MLCHPHIIRLYQVGALCSGFSIPLGCSLTVSSSAFSRVIPPFLLGEKPGKSFMLSRSQSTLIRGAGRGKVWLILLFSGRSRFRCGLASCHLFMAIVCFSVSQLKPDAGSPSRLKGESKSHPRAGLAARGSPALLRLPRCPVAPRTCCSALRFPGRRSIAAADLLLNVVCRHFLQLVWHS